jgi:hypothetical protein
MSDNNEAQPKQKTVAELVEGLTSSLQHVSNCYESNRKIVENHDELIRGLAALLENHTAAIRAHQVIIEGLAAKAGVVLTAVNQGPDSSGPPN